VAKATAKSRDEELQCHDHARSEQDRGLYLAPYKIRARIIISAHTNVDNV